MGFKCGIVGLPNVGKSTLFNALTQTASAEAANYPFCTIEPNVGEVPVPDPRLEKIAAIVRPQAVVPTRLTFVDIAGLVKGASKGEGLGNQFLAHIREVDAIAYTLRCFDDADVTHVGGRIDPLSDAEIVETELMLADMESLEKRIEPLEKKLRGQDKEARKTLELVHLALAMLQNGKPARLAGVAEEDRRAFRALNLLTSKRVLYVCNVDEASAATGNEYSKNVEARVADDARSAGAGDPRPAEVVVISARIEAELAQLPEDERTEYLNELGLAEPGLARLIRAGYNLLELITFFTAGEKQVRAWTVRENTRAPRAAAVIHTDFEKGFIRAETITYDDFIKYNGETGAREAGRMRLEGKDYVVKDGDLLHFRFAT
ncbi:MAG TPA: redox-regulated ATPase YchF [Rhizobiales bacterium]|nr:redox-regulated ATPase YchF [Hyphomicrobiales bacterium]